MTARAEALVALLRMDPSWRDPNEARSHVSPMQHALQCATKAFNHNAKDHEMVTAALLHDAARPLSDVRHGQVIAEALRDRVRRPVYEALYDHGVYQEALLHEDRRLNPAIEGHRESLLLASWDAASFDPDYVTDPLEFFIPYVERTMNARRQDLDG